MKVAVVGTGYVGLVSGVCLAHLGHQVTCVDVDPEKVEMIHRKDPPIYEKGLAELLEETVPARLSATTNLRDAVLQSDLSMICVGTPFDGEHIDLKYIKQAAREIGEALADKSEWHMVVVKSTVVPGTTVDVVLPILEEASGKKAGRDFGVGMNPEFLREGEAIDDFMNPDRIVLGGIDQQSIDALGALYAVFDGVDKISTGPSTAELIKYTANSLLATLISFSNEIANLSARVSVDVADVMTGVHLDKRFSPILADGSRVNPGSNSYLWPGAGFGGSCFPKDVKALISHGESRGVPMQLLKSVIDINERQPEQMINLLRTKISNLQNVPIAVLGVAFKPGTDDIRESPSLKVLQRLRELGANIKVYDPIVGRSADEAPRMDLNFADTLDDALEGAEAVLLMTSWPEFSALPEKIQACSPAPILIDGRRAIQKDSVETYLGIGLPG